MLDRSYQRPTINVIPNGGNVQEHWRLACEWQRLAAGGYDRIARNMWAYNVRALQALINQ